MDLYSIVLFVHIVGALVLFVLLTVEGVGLRAGFPSAALNRVLGPISALAILFPGLYLMKAQWGWTGWVVVGIAAWFLIAVIGAGTGIGVMRGRITRQAATASWLIRVGMALGVVFDMTVKPSLLVSLGAVVAGIAIGGAVSVAGRRGVLST
ncbi:MAG: hypothetical protein E6J08_06140 [Chloroflexi bacterium]|nr:MAG: hypothetical protein E6J08_06140 [Chloroflexota bacterium]